MSTTGNGVEKILKGGHASVSNDSRRQQTASSSSSSSAQLSPLFSAPTNSQRRRTKNEGASSVGEEGGRGVKNSPFHFSRPELNALRTRPCRRRRRRRRRRLRRRQGKWTQNACAVTSYCLAPPLESRASSPRRRPPCFLESAPPGGGRTEVWARQLHPEAAAFAAAAAEAGRLLARASHGMKGGGRKKRGGRPRGQRTKTRVRRKLGLLPPVPLPPLRQLLGKNTGLLIILVPHFLSFTSNLV